MEKKAIMVRKKGLEPSRQKVQTPEACASTNSATFALRVGDPDESRTHDHRLRKPILYPPELRDHEQSLAIRAILYQDYPTFQENSIL